MAVVRVNTSAGWLDLGSGDGGGEFYEQDEEPEDASVGAIWYDTDADPVTGGGGLAMERRIGFLVTRMVEDDIVVYQGALLSAPARCHLLKRQMLDPNLR